MSGPPPTPSTVGSGSASNIGFFTQTNEPNTGISSSTHNSHLQGKAKRSRAYDTDANEDTRVPVQKARTSSISSTSIKKDTHASSPGGGGGGGTDGPKRATHACLRCRKQKLKCIGGWPCDRCTKSKNICDFGRPSMSINQQPASTTSTSITGTGLGIGVGGDEANARLEQLESSVANLLAGLASAGNGGAIGNELMHTFDPTKRRAELSTAVGVDQPFPPGDSKQWSTAIPPPTHIRRLDPPRSNVNTHTNHLLYHPNSQADLSASPDDVAQIQSRTHHVRFTSSPQSSFIPHHPSPSVYGSSGTGPSPVSSCLARVESTDLSATRKKKGKGQNAEERLATATEGDYDEAPFKSLVYQPAVWDNREQSRRSSPQPSQPASRDEPSIGTYEKRFMRDLDDPVNTELVSLRMAETLFNFFIDHCHPFMPVVNVALDDAFNTIRQSSFLISAIIAVGARFYIRFTSRSPGAYPPLDPLVPQRLAHLAEAHLANTMLRKQHALSDVQAVMLLAAWGLRSGGRGPDAWVVTGHAARIARRLGVHKVLGQAAEMARMTRPGTDGWEKLETFMPQWRTWLCWFCFDGFLSLGFGRPQSTQFETVDEQGFLQIRLNQSLPRPGSTRSISLYGDVYIAGQVQLTQIGRDLINWGDMLADPKSALWADPRRADMFRDKELHVKNMFKDLNNRLDEWYKLWVWSGSPYSLYLGSSARIARLQADHMRLCLNSFALKSGPNEDNMIASCLKKALDAAMSTIQTHYESSQTDLALSFATDYLTITLAQAAVFLIRIAKASPSISITSTDPSVIAHYLRMSIDLLVSGELSETRLSSYLAKTIRGIARAADIAGLGLQDMDEEESRPQSRRTSPPTQQNSNSNFDANTEDNDNGNDNNDMDPSNVDFGITLPDSNLNATENFDMESFLQFESQLDLGYLLGLPSDNNSYSYSTTHPGVNGGGSITPQNINYGSLGFGESIGAEFSFGMNGLGSNFAFDLGLTPTPAPAPTTQGNTGMFGTQSQSQTQTQDNTNNGVFTFPAAELQGEQKVFSPRTNN